MRIYVDRIGTVWWRDCYEIPADENGKPDEEALQDAIDDYLKPEWSEPLPETWESGDDYEVFNEEWNLIKSSDD